MLTSFFILKSVIKNLLMYVCIYSNSRLSGSLEFHFIQVHLKKKCEYHEKGQYFLSLISESETHILYRFIYTEWNIYLILEILMITAYR